MLHQELSIEVEPRCISVWKEPWAKRFARVTLLVDFDDQFAIVIACFKRFLVSTRRRGRAKRVDRRDGEKRGG